METSALQDLIASFQRDVAETRHELALTRLELTSVRHELAETRTELAEAQRKILEQETENTGLKQQVGDLRRQLGKDSSNSSKPPSSDGLGKKPRVSGSLRTKSGKTSGGQPGHKGDTLRSVANPDRIEHHRASHCVHCQGELSRTMLTGMEKRQVFDIPLPRLEVTEHQASIYTCSGCHGVTKADFPNDVTGHVQYGPRIRATAVYLNAQHFIPEDRIGDIMRDLFGTTSLCPASIVAWSEKKASDLKLLVADISALIDKAPVRNLDETGFRVAGITQWLHTASTPDLTHYRVSQKRGAMLMDLESGVIVHDHFRPYYLIPGVSHALCNAHHLRELKCLIDIEKELWAQNMAGMLKGGLRAVQRAVAQGQDRLDEATLRSFEVLYDSLVAAGLALHEQQPPLAGAPGKRRSRAKRPGHNLAIRMKDFKNEVLRFLYDFTVPFTNNLAEQDIRMMKVKMKISGGFRTMQGANVFTSLRSVLSTARKKNWNIIETLTAPGEKLRSALAA